MFTRRTIILLAALVLLVSVVVRHLWVEAHTRRWCGHMGSLGELLSGYTHCCIAGDVISEAELVRVAQFRYRLAHKRFAENYDELHDERHGEPFGHSERSISWVTTSSRLFIHITKDRELPGYFLIDDRGRIFFNQDREATVNDLWLNP
jgi:hypothetical protein